MAKTEVVNNDAVTLRINEEPVEKMLSEAADLTGHTLDLIEDRISDVHTVVKNNPYLIAGAFVLGAGIAGFVAYKIAVKRTTLKYEDILEVEIDASRRFYKRLAKDGEFETPESAVEALVPDEVIEAVRTYQGKPARVAYDKIEVSEEAQEEIVVQAETVNVNVFEAGRPDPRDWDYDGEIKLREENPNSPYVISFEEFQVNEENHEQTTLSYFAADDTLADEKEQPIDNTEHTVGDDNLTRFGAGSKDNNVVYIRNERLGMDFEVVRSTGSYKKEVLGFDDETELKHSGRHPNRKFRGTDE